MLDFKDLLGKKHKRNGRGPNEFDCYGLCQEVCRRIGIILPEQPGFEGFEKCANQINKVKAIDFIKLDKPRPYCLVTFMLRPPLVTHVGVVLKNCYQFIHIMKKRAVCIERLDNTIWRKRIDGFYWYKLADN